MTEMRDTAMTSKAWPFEEARKLVKRYAKGAPEKGFVLFETGYGPSGLPHIGTFGEVARTTMVRNAFEVLSDIPTKLICFSDDLDGMRKVPGNVPNGKVMEGSIQKPLTSVPDPYGEYESFGARNNAILRRFLDTFGFEYDFISSTEFYASGKFDEVLLRAVKKYDEVMAVMLKSLREERAATYSIFLPISPSTGRVLYVPITIIDADNGIIGYTDEDGTDVETVVTGGNVKLQWKPDFGARWSALDVDFEMYGKDHSTNTPIYDRICQILGGRKPEHFVYELFLDEEGHKISKTTGNGITIDEWLTYAAPESLSYFMYQKPKSAKRMHFDVIPKAVDEYHQQLRAYAGQDLKAQLANPVFHIHGGDVPVSNLVVPFAMLLNLASVSHAEDKSQLWGFIQRYAPETSAETHPDMDDAAGFAVRYYNDFVKPSKVFRAPTDVEREALGALRDALAAYDGDVTGDALQSVVFSIGRERFDPMRDWFKALYEVIMGASQGPRFGGFIALYGVDETVALIDSALAGELV